MRISLLLLHRQQNEMTTASSLAGVGIHIHQNLGCHTIMYQHYIDVDPNRIGICN